MKPSRPSAQMAANARKNRGKTPWRNGPHVAHKHQNHARYRAWQEASKE